MPYKYLTTRDLLNAFKKADMQVSFSWLYRQEQKGNLKMPKSTTNFKKIPGNKPGAVRIFTRDQIDAIVQAFTPGGKGYWSYESA